MKEVTKRRATLSGRNIIKLKFYFSESKRFYPHLNRTEIEPFDISSMSDQDIIKQILV